VGYGRAAFPIFVEHGNDAIRSRGVEVYRAE